MRRQHLKPCGGETTDPRVDVCTPLMGVGDVIPGQHILSAAQFKILKYASGFIIGRKISI